MRKKYVPLLLWLVSFCLILASCNKDEPFVKPKLSFSTATQAANEADKTIEATVSLDKAFTEDITIGYVLKGTAVDKVAATATNSAYDYEITSDYLEAVIAKGETTGKIEIKIFSDFSLEPAEPETIIITIKTVDNENIEITREDEIEISVTQEDGLLVVLEWGIGTGETYTDVDMDLFLWAEDASSTLGLTNVVSTRPSFVSPEFFFLPTAGLTDGTYGLSCNYYEGSKDPMNFVVSFIEVVNNDDAATTVINGFYGQVNVNKWDVQPPGIDPILVHTFEKAGTDFNTFIYLGPPSAGSRSITGTLPKEVVKQGKLENLPKLPAWVLKSK